jgi:hypothetical protein
MTSPSRSIRMLFTAGLVVLAAVAALYSIEDPFADFG